jgi:hypothetical protein
VPFLPDSLVLVATLHRELRVHDVVFIGINDEGRHPHPHQKIADCQTLRPSRLFMCPRLCLSPRWPVEITILSKYKTPQQIFRRVENDVMRYRLQRAGAVVRNPQTCQIDPTAEIPSVSRWGN